MKKILTVIMIYGLLSILTSTTHAMQAPFIDTYANYDAFLAGVDYYLFDEDYEFKAVEIDLHEQYYISYKIEHSAYNRRNFSGHGEAIITYQSKDKTKDYHFELIIRIKTSETVMQVKSYTFNDYGTITLYGGTNYVSIILLNDRPLPEAESRMIFQSICDIYSLSMEEPT